MKKYIQLTAGRGPVECARAVALVARELLKDFPDAELVENEPHNTEPDCYMSMLFLAEVSPAKEQEWSGTVLWRAASDRYRPGHPRRNWFVGVEFIEPISLPDVSDKDIVRQVQQPTLAVAEQRKGTQPAPSETAAKKRLRCGIFPCVQMGQAYLTYARKSSENILGSIMILSIQKL